MSSHPQASDQAVEVFVRPEIDHRGWHPHYWISVAKFADHHFAICFCRFVGPGMLTREAALAVPCEIEQNELASAERAALIGVRR